MLCMFISSMCSGFSTYLQKHLFMHSQISPYETFYWAAILMIIMKLSVMFYLKVDPIFVKKEHRLTIILRGVIGVSSNTFSITSLLFIPLTKSSMIYWTLPIFTAIFARVFLNEKLTKYDWIATILAFVGILVMQNPFATNLQSEDSVYDVIGTVLCIFGAITGGITMVCIRKMGKDVHYLQSPLFFSLTNLMLCPIFQGLRLTVRPYLNVYSQYDVMMIVLVAIFQFCNLIFATLAYQFEKAGRVSPIAYSQIILVSILDVLYLGTRLKVNQIIGGIIIVCSNLTISILKCAEVIK
eukprot:403352903